MKKYIPPALIAQMRNAFRPVKDHLAAIPLIESVEQRKQATLDTIMIIEALLPNHQAIRSIKTEL